MRQTSASFRKTKNLCQPVLNFIQQNNMQTRKSRYQPIMPQLLKMSKMKHAHREHLLGFGKKLQENTSKLQQMYFDYDGQNKNNVLQLDRYQQRLTNTDILSLYSSTQVDSKIINKLKISQQESGKNHRNFYSSYLQKCRIATQKFDAQKNQIVSKSKLKKHKRNNSEPGSLPEQHHGQKVMIFKTSENEIYENGKQNQQIILKKKKIQRKKGINRSNRYWSEDNSERKAQRYVNVSVAEFMDQKQQNISARTKQKFEALRKQNKNLSQIEIESFKPQFSRTLYPLVTCRVENLSKQKFKNQKDINRFG